MEEKERLAKLLEKFSCPHSVAFCDRCGHVYDGKGCVTYTDMAESLIQNGVTIATDTNDKWVSVDEPPKKTGIYQIYMYDLDWNRWKVWYGQFVSTHGCWFVYDIQGDSVRGTVTHWQPLTEPPKGVQ